MNDALTVILPIGGTGERFKNEGIKTYKPFIRLDGKTIFELALASYPAHARYLIIIREEFEKQFAALSLTRNVSFLKLRENTRGPLETISCFFDDERINGENQVLIGDCDALIAADELIRAVNFFCSVNAVGGVTIRRANNSQYSYCRLQDTEVLETREKDPFSPWSTTGPYWWRTGKDFVTDARAALAEKIFSISPIYNFTIKRGGSVRAFSTETFEHLGTPGELNEYASRMNLKIT
jgi:NDP-sugar pyrophosphorylase family protein